MKKFLVIHFLDFEGYSIDEYDDLASAEAQYQWLLDHGYNDGLCLLETKVLKNVEDKGV